jgi:hypothetical protein
VERAEEDFRRKVRNLLHSEATLGEKVKDSTKGEEHTEKERRSLAGWCARFAKTGRWASIRDKLLWVKVVDGKLCIALRVELARQQGIRDFDDLSQGDFLGLCKKYAIGKEHRAGGERCVVLEQGFIDDLYEQPGEDS